MSNNLASVDEFIDALSVDEPICHYRCRGVPDDRRCLVDSPQQGWRCSLPKGHYGQHVACAEHGRIECEGGHATLSWFAKRL